MGTKYLELDYDRIMLGFGNGLRGTTTTAVLYTPHLGACPHAQLVMTVPAIGVQVVPATLDDMVSTTFLRKIDRRRGMSHRKALARPPEHPAIANEKTNKRKSSRMEKLTAHFMLVYEVYDVVVAVVVVVSH